MYPMGSSQTPTPLDALVAAWSRSRTRSTGRLLELPQDLDLRRRPGCELAELRGLCGLQPLQVLQGRLLPGFGLCLLHARYHLLGFLELRLELTQRRLKIP